MLLKNLQLPKLANKIKLPDLHKLVYLKEAILCLKANRLRSFLALLGLLIGTASVVALITIGFLARQAAIDQFKNLGTQKLLLHISTDNKLELTELNNTLNDALLNQDSTKHTIINSKKNQTQNNIFNPNIISKYYPLTNFFKSAYFNNHRLQSYQVGITQGLQDSLKLKLNSGRFIHNQDSMRYFAVLGSDIVKNIKQETKQDIQIGDYLTIDNNYFTIIGILEHWPTDPLFSYNINRTILIPYNTAQYLSNDYRLKELYIDVHPDISPKKAENYLRNLFTKITPSASLQFSNAEQILQQLDSQARILTILLGTIGAISLLVGAIGVMNIMLVAIVERRSEIGLRMAIGANPYEIKLQFLCETICLTSIGGLLGTLLGITIPYIITLIAGWKFILPISSVIFGLSVSLIVGLAAGFYPAIKASRMLPVACLNNT